jgi:hypothetical protein
LIADQRTAGEESFCRDAGSETWFCAADPGRATPAQPSVASQSLQHAPQHVWQKRFYDFNVWTARKRVEKLRYMHRNPVQRGLLMSLELWRWSSFRAYFFGEAGPVAVNTWDVLKMRIRAPAA